MSQPDDTPRDVRDLRIMWRTVTVVAIVVACCIGSVIYAVAEWTRLVTRVESVEKWQSAKDRDASRELWRRERERWTAPTPPKG